LISKLKRAVNKLIFCVTSKELVMREASRFAAALFAGAAAAAVAPGLFVAEPIEAAVLSNGAGAPPYGGNMCADVRGASAGSGTPVQIWSCYGGLNQQFSFAGNVFFVITCCGPIPTSKPGGPSIQILAMGASLCLDATGSGTSAGTPVQAYSCNGTPAQAWRYSQFGQIININSNLCLDGAGAEGTQLVTNPCVGAVDSTAAISNVTNPPIPSQVWQLK
jgi:hypothetical protein